MGELKYKIYINNIPMEDYEEEELMELRRKLTIKSMAAIGYVPLSEVQKREAEEE